MKKKQLGLKYDSAKSPLDLIPYELNEEVGYVLAFGAKKYARANWAKGIQHSRLIAAALRHINKYNMGEDIDPESNTCHIANAATNLAFLLWMIKNRSDLDDRWVKELKHGKKTRQRRSTRRSTSKRKSRA